MKSPIAYFLLGLVFSIWAFGSSTDLLEQYRNAGNKAFSAARGETAWFHEYPQKQSGESRSCTTCHGVDPSKSGKHVKTGKVIEPLALSVNSSRFSDTKKVEKWFRRNCKWTMGRECSNQEKGDFIKYLISQ